MPTHSKHHRSSLLTRLSRKLYRTKRAVLNRRGDGVHSPYAFATIRQVFRNPHPYNAFELLGYQLRQGAPALRAQYGDRLILRPEVAEVIFRLVHRESLGRIVLVAPGASALPAYLEQTGKVACLEHAEHLSDIAGLETAELVIIEDLPLDELPHLEAWLSQLAQREAPLSLLWHRSHPLLGECIKPWRRLARPTASFCSLELELWVWRPQLTPGHYKVYSH